MGVVSLHPLAVAALVTRAESFWRRVDTSGGPAACWPWLGTVNDNGYGQVSFGVDGLSIHTSTHRAAYTIARGPIPEGLHIDHLCSTKVCVNPAHLEPVTQAENARRRSQRDKLAGSIHARTTPRGARRWRVMWRERADDGGWRQRSQTFQSLEAAEEFLAQRVSQLWAA